MTNASKEAVVGAAKQYLALDEDERQMFQALVEISQSIPPKRGRPRGSKNSTPEEVPSV